MPSRMHELSIAQNVVQYALAEAAKNNSEKVEEISLEVGELTQVETKVLADALQLLMKGPKLDGCRVVVVASPAAFACRRCSARWGMSEVRKELDSLSDGLLVREPDSKEVPLHFLPMLYSAFIHCPTCGSSDVSAESGDDIRVRRLALE